MGVTYYLIVPVDIGLGRFPDVEENVGILAEHPVQTALTDVGVIHAVPGLVGGAHVAVVMARVAGATLMLQDGVELVADSRTLKRTRGVT